ncbi:hypothetical protein [Chitinophaga sp. CB10]|uniref:hypothetical protein n=1 Tax=Chitinophaga sp. CB10 TaxID=1891659 RepID=UPI0025C2B067|nr:hypothetical protein [Chitinophaga sp. CB10]
MHGEEELLKKFNHEFGSCLEDYALLKDGETKYSIVNVPLGAMFLLDDAEIAEFFINKLMELRIPIYSSEKGIPGWGAKKDGHPPEMNPLLKDVIESFKRKERK